MSKGGLCYSDAAMDIKPKTVFILTLSSLLVNLAMAVGKALVGYFGHSYALIADAIESTGDVFSSFLVLIGLRFATQPPDENHPYGHGRIEPLLTFVVVGVLMASATVIAYESLHHSRQAHPTPHLFTLVFLFGVIAAKEIAYRVMVRYGRAFNSTALKAEAWHHRSDAITSFVAFLGILVAIVGGPRFAFFDDLAAFISSGFILYNSYLIFRPALGEIMDEHTHDALIAQIRAVSVGVVGVEATEKCYVRKIGMTYLIDLHIMVDGDLSVTRGHDIAHRLKDRLCADIPHIRDVLIHVEPSTPT